MTKTTWLFTQRLYSLYGHIKALAEAEKAGLAKAGIDADIYQVAETLNSEVLAKMHAPPKSDYPVIDAAKLATYDGFLFGVPTRFGNFPAQWKAFWDSTGGLWATGGLSGKFAGVFVSSGSPGGGQESTVISTLSTLTHHGNGPKEQPHGNGHAHDTADTHQNVKKESAKITKAPVAAEAKGKDKEGPCGLPFKCTIL
ncbi:hypothetical protein BUE80_DR009819 [Diplocarpon rosae]|nr:hypothetical protein BUE80_DR009819 [Diplocarpon rosae]